MLTREEIRTVYDQGPEAVITLIEHLCTLIDQQQAEITQLKARVKELEDRLSLDSRNSSKPPSSDGPAQRNRSLRTPSGKKPGAQKGHPGTTLQRSPTPDRSLRHAPAACTSCGHSLESMEGQPLPDARQVFDLPVLKLEVTEHRLIEKCCPWCGTTSRGHFPEGVAPGAQYGDQLKALLVYLTNYHLLPWQRTCELISDLLGQPLAEGTLQAALSACSAGLAATEAQIKDAISGAAVANFDETGLYVAGHRHWLHVSSTPTLTHYAAHPKRGAAATAEIGILGRFRGRACHDAFASYFTYECEHGLCNAHHLRELTFVKEQLAQDWAGEMKGLLLEIKQSVEQARAHGQTSLSAAQAAQFELTYDQLLAAGLQLPDNLPPPPNGKRGRRKQSKAKNLLDRLAKYKGETLAFMHDFRVPFDNNQAERDLRMVKVQQKVSGSFRTPDGADYFCRIRGYISTVKKQGLHVLTALKSVFTGQPLLPLLDG